MKTIQMKKPVASYSYGGMDISVQKAFGANGGRIISYALQNGAGANDAFFAKKLDVLVTKVKGSDGKNVGKAQILTCGNGVFFLYHPGLLGKIVFDLKERRGVSDLGYDSIDGANTLNGSCDLPRGAKLPISMWLNALPKAEGALAGLDDLK